jgi:hypothetical protein
VIDLLSSSFLSLLFETVADIQDAASDEMAGFAGMRCRTTAKQHSLK